MHLPSFLSTWALNTFLRLKKNGVRGLCRCREKQRKEASRLQTVNRKLTAMNKLLMEENDRLQKQVSQLVCENGYMRQQLHTVSVYFACFSVSGGLLSLISKCLKI